MIYLSLAGTGGKRLVASSYLLELVPGAQVRGWGKGFAALKSYYATYCAVRTALTPLRRVPRTGAIATTIQTVCSSFHFGERRISPTDNKVAPAIITVQLKMHFCKLCAVDFPPLSQHGWGGGRLEERLPIPAAAKRRLSHTKRRSLSSDQVTIM